MAKNETSYEYIVRLMTDAGTYDPRYEMQIEDAADTRDLIRKIRKEIGRDLVSNEMKTGGVDIKKVANPLLETLAKYKKLFQGQLAALGLNYDGYKKPSNVVADKEADQNDNDPTADYFGAINKPYNI